MNGRARALAWTVGIAAVVLNIAGYALGLYRWVLFDEVVHAFTSFALVLLAAVYLYGVVLTGARTNPVTFVAVAACIGLALGGLWEVAEWLFDLVAPGDVIKGKPDTMGDLVVDAVGSIGAGWVAQRLADR